MKANLFIPGMPKCGSYFLYDLLDQHPDINMCKVKEPAYFTGKIDQKVYESKFSDKDNIFYGEATVEYLIEPNALKKIKNEVSDPKFIILLRHPVKRAISHYFHRVNGGIDKTSLSDLLKNDHSYPIHYSSYKNHLINFFKIFDKNQALIIISEELYKNPVLTYNEILQFLDLQLYTPQLSEANQNKGKNPKSLKLSYYLRKLSRNNKLKEKLGELLPIFRSVRKQLESLNITTKNQKDSIKPEYISLLEDKFKEDAIYLRELLDRDDVWVDL